MLLLQMTNCINNNYLYYGFDNFFYGLIPSQYHSLKFLVYYAIRVET